MSFCKIYTYCAAREEGNIHSEVASLAITLSDSLYASTRNPGETEYSLHLRLATGECYEFCELSQLLVD